MNFLFGRKKEYTRKKVRRNSYNLSKTDTREVELEQLELFEVKKGLRGENREVELQLSLVIVGY